MSIMQQLTPKQQCTCPILIRIRRLPSSPLFPYTTLFRSEGREVYLHGGNSGTFLLYRKRVGFIGYGSLARCLQPLLDRKSTRLNSSHRCISYAVFCLKKKKLDARISSSTGRNRISL